jgi:tRNA1(Val) A37 N6-methylase TrmN6
MMSIENLWMAILSGFGAVLIFLLKRIFLRMDGLERDVARGQLNLAENYISKADFMQSHSSLKADIADMSKKLDRMLDLIHQKADR